jgi:hypothetical protein
VYYNHNTNNYASESITVAEDMHPLDGRGILVEGKEIQAIPI